MLWIQFHFQFFLFITKNTNNTLLTKPNLVILNLGLFTRIGQIKKPATLWFTYFMIKTKFNLKKRFNITKYIKFIKLLPKLQVNSFIQNSLTDFLPQKVIFARFIYFLTNILMIQYSFQTPPVTVEEWIEYLRSCYCPDKGGRF